MKFLYISHYLPKPITLIYCTIKRSTELKKKTHGGKRIGSGRPKLNNSEKKEPTKVIRVPVSKLDAVKELIK